MSEIGIMTLGDHKNPKVGIMRPVLLCSLGCMDHKLKNIF